jgi:hypothetical protein
MTNTKKSPKTPARSTSLAPVRAKKPLPSTDQQHAHVPNATSYVAGRSGMGGAPSPVSPQAQSSRVTGAGQGKHAPSSPAAIAKAAVTNPTSTVVRTPASISSGEGASTSKKESKAPPDVQAARKRQDFVLRSRQFYETEGFMSQAPRAKDAGPAMYPALSPEL